MNLHALYRPCYYIILELVWDIQGMIELSNTFGPTFGRHTISEYFVQIGSEFYIGV